METPQPGNPGTSHSYFLTAEENMRIAKWAQDVEIAKVGVGSQILQKGSSSETHQHQCSQPAIPERNPRRENYQSVPPPIPAKNPLRYKNKE